MQGSIVEEDAEQCMSEVGADSSSMTRGRTREVVTSGIRAKSAPPHYRRPADIAPPRDGYRIHHLCTPEVASDESRSVANGGYELVDRSGGYVLRCSGDMDNPHPVHFLTKGFLQVWGPKKRAFLTWASC